MIDAILSDHQYNTLGFAAPFISNTHVDTLVIAEPKRTDDGSHVMMGRITFVVRVPENVEKLTGKLIDGYDTVIKIDTSAKGYKIIGENPY